MRAKGQTVPELSPLPDIDPSAENETRITPTP